MGTAVLGRVAEVGSRFSDCNKCTHLCHIWRGWCVGGKKIVQVLQLHVASGPRKFHSQGYNGSKVMANMLETVQ